MARKEGSATLPTIPNPDAPGDYTVVARRYRPQRFEDVVGQDHVVRALRNAIRLNRVTHAYLFSGTRGVGKTSMARIFAKCLNCVHGPTETPCNECDICQAISSGQDVDVIEIDGASNNGVEAVRELRQNAGLRPSRSRFKIYYIDEVHMLSTGAFNALLKTLEEPPPHVKFLFATTEPNKIPITVLSRCQRYDFAGIIPDMIAETLADICKREGVEADDEGLRAIARRASGSMRDAQSLLEQLLSVGDRLTADVVHQQLGIASDERTLDLLDALADRDPARVLMLVDQAVGAGVQPPELLGGALDFLRDAMVLAAGANASLLAATSRQRAKLQAIVERWPLDTILAAMQILAEYRMKLRGSPHGRLLVETALVRAARLESMTELGEVIARLATLEGDGPASLPAEKKKPVVADPASRPWVARPPREGEAPAEPGMARSVPSGEAREQTRVSPGSAGASPSREIADGTPPPAPADGRLAWEVEAIREGWPRMVEGLEPDLAVKVSRLAPTAILGPNQLAVGVDRAYNWVADACETPETKARIEAKIGAWLGRAVSLRIDRPAADQAPALARPTLTFSRDEAVRDDPMVKQVVELFEARAVRVEVDDGGG